MAPLALLIALAAQTSAASAQAPADEAPARVFFAQIAAGQDTSEAEVSLIQDAVLVAAREHAVGFEILSVTDVQGLLAAESEAVAAGCDVLSCASELADALNAPQLITGQLGRIGDTWLLTLTRTDRDTLAVLGREQLQQKGPAPDVLLSGLPSVVARLFGAPEPVTSAVSPLVIGGAAGVGAGLLVAGVGGIVHLLALGEYNAATTALALPTPDLDTARSAKQTGEFEQVVAWSLYGLGAVVIVVGAAALGFGFVSEGL